MRIKAAIRTLNAMIGSARPVILYHKPTACCDCRCCFCDAWLRQPKADDVLPSDQITALLHQAWKAGMSMYTVWGGEPLLVEALPSWLAQAKDLGLRTVVCTSGQKLEARAAELGKHTDRLLVSLEGVGERHDALRQVPGLFDRVVRGLELFRKHSKAEITIWTNLNRKNRDQLKEIARWAQELRLPVEVFPMAAYAGYNEALHLNASERHEVFGEALDLKRSGYPILNTNYALSLMRSGRPFRCRVPRLSVQVLPNGQVVACEPRVHPGLASYGNIQELDFEELRHSDLYHAMQFELSNCNRCLLPCVANMADSLWAQLLRQGAQRLFCRWRLT